MTLLDPAARSEQMATTHGLRVLNAIEVLERAALGPESQGTAAQFLKCLGEGGMFVIENPLVPAARVEPIPGGVAEIAEAARVLAEFAKTAPGRLPQRVQDAIAAVSLPSSTPGLDPKEQSSELLQLIDRLDGYLNSPEQVALHDDLLAALRPVGTPGLHPTQAHASGMAAIHHPGTSCRAKNMYGQCGCREQCALKASEKARRSGLDPIRSSDGEVNRVFTSNGQGLCVNCGQDWGEHCGNRCMAVGHSKDQGEQQ